MISRKLMHLCFGALALTVGQLHAGTMMFMEQLEQTRAEVNGTGEGTFNLFRTFDFNLPQFDMPGANLISATIKYEVISSEVKLTTTNTGNTALTFDFESSVATQSPVFPPDLPGSSGGGGGEETLQPGEFFESTGILGPDFTKVVTDPADLANFYVGSGSVNSAAFLFGATHIINKSTGGNDDLSQLDTSGFFEATVKATITYEYESAGAVPEPTSLAIFGIGALGLMTVRRRRR